MIGRVDLTFVAPPRYGFGYWVAHSHDGGATAVELGAGFVAIRKSGTGLLPGPKVRTTASPDYRGLRHGVRMQAVLVEGDAVLMVDDWAEQGSQAAAAVHWSSSAGPDG